MAAFTDEDVFRARILTDDKQLRRLIKKMTLLTSAQGSQGGAIPPEELEEHYAAFMAELAFFSNTLNYKSSRLSSSSKQDIAYYEQSLSAISAQQEAAKSTIQDLSSQLKDAQQERANKLEYDSLAARIQQLPARNTSIETIARLEKEIADLGHESDAFKTVWDRRQAAFGQIVVALEETFSSLREEKTEMERKGAMDEDEVDGDGGPASPKSSGDADLGKERTLNPTLAEFTPSAAPQAEEEPVIMEEGEL